MVTNTCISAPFRSTCHHAFSLSLLIQQRRQRQHIRNLASRRLRLACPYLRRDRRQGTIRDRRDQRTWYDRLMHHCSPILVCIHRLVYHHLPQVNPAVYTYHPSAREPGHCHRWHPPIQLLGPNCNLSYLACGIANDCIIIMVPKVGCLTRGCHDS